MTTQKRRLGPLLLAATLALTLGLALAGNILAAPGALDTSFSGDGKQTVSFPNNGNEAHGVAVQNDGKVVLVGSAFGSSSIDFAVSRLTASGALDTSFNGTGNVLTDIASNSGDAASAVLIQNGKILVVGTSNQGPAGTYFALVRYNSNGSLDTSFNGTGKLTFGINGSPSSAQANAVALQSDGKIVVAGTSANNFAVARFTANGASDNTFNGVGSFTADFNGMTDSANGVAIQNGKIVVAGEAGSSSGSSFGVIRLNANGTLDTSFNGTGKVTTAFPDGQSKANGVIVQSDGKIVAAGQALVTTFDFALVRYNTDGSLDSSFGIGGKLSADFNGSDDFGNAVSYDVASGQITVVGDTYVGLATGNDFAIARFNANGGFDTSFGSGGKVTTNFSGTNHDTAFALAPAPGNKLVVAGSTYAQSDGSTGSHFAVARYGVAATPTPTVTPCTITFSDVQTSDFFYEPVRYLACNGVISGYSDNTFRPGANATRGQLAKIVVAATGLPFNTNAGPHFIDVPTSNPFYNYIETAYNAGLIGGYDLGNGTREFRYGANVTRGQLSKIIVNAKGWTLANPATPSFIDVPTTNPFFHEIETAYAHNIISGYDLGNGTREFRWGNNATRGQISKIVYLAVTQTLAEEKATK